MPSRRNLAALFATLLLAACRHRAARPPAAPDAGTDQIRAVYDEKGPPQKIAERLCGLLHESIERRRGICCSLPPRSTFGALCVQTLSSALRDGVVKLDPSGIDRCEAALNKALAGCEWVGAFSPRLPDECQGLLAGTLSTGSVCRSSFECIAGQRCFGAGPTDRGRCVPAGQNGATCGGSVDVLGAYVRQDLEPAHAECQGFCNRNRCEAVRPPGAECKFEAECGTGHYCGEGRCQANPFAKKGSRCQGGGCEPGTRCVGGVCIEPKGSGEPCTSELECLGGCLRPNGAKSGKCGPRCSQL